MIRLPPDRAAERFWVVCEASDRWSRAVRRFAPELLPPSLFLTTIDVTWSTLTSSVAKYPTCVVLCDVERSSFGSHCESLARIASKCPHSLRLVAGNRLTDHQRVVLSELGVAAHLAQPEYLPRLSRMLAAHFASPGHLLD